MWGESIHPLSSTVRAMGNLIKKYWIILKLDLMSTLLKKRYNHDNIKGIA